MRCLPIYRSHISLLRDEEGLLQKMDSICFTYQHVGCLYTNFTHRLGEKIVVKIGQVIGLGHGVIYSNQNLGDDKMSCVSKKVLSKQKYWKQFSTSVQKTKSTLISGEVFGDRIDETI